MNCPSCSHAHYSHSVQDGDRIKCEQCKVMFTVRVYFVAIYTTAIASDAAVDPVYDADTFRSDWGPYCG